MGWDACTRFAARPLPSIRTVLLLVPKVPEPRKLSALPKSAAGRAYLFAQALSRYFAIVGASQSKLTLVDLETGRRTPKDSARWYQELIAAG